MERSLKIAPQRSIVLTLLQVAMEVVVDNFAVLAIENCILNKLSNTFSPETMMKLDDHVIEKIALETEDSQVERARAVRKLKSLEAGLQTLSRFSRNKETGK